MKEFVEFPVTLAMRKEWLQGYHSETGVTGQKYRLFSVIEHVGELASRGHYVNYALDSDDCWQKFDDNKVHPREEDQVLNTA